MSEQQVIEDFLSGQRDCRDGIPHKAGKSESYDSGYRCQYELEQMKAERSAKHEFRIA